MRKLASLLSVLMLLCTLALAQTRTITGVVKDEKGVPIPFATVLETGTKNDTQADGNGLFSNKIGATSKLTITATGFNPQTVTPGEGGPMITLTTKPGQMQEVVVSTFTGVKRQSRSLGAATATISNAELNQSKPINPVT